MAIKLSLSTSILLILALAIPVIPRSYAAKPSSLSTASETIDFGYGTSTSSADATSPTDSSDTTNSLSGSLDSGSWTSSSSASVAASTGASTAQWIELNTPMGKITECSTIELTWTSSGINGPLEIDLVSATTGDVTTITTDIDPATTTSYKWTVAASPDTYFLEGNAQDYSALIYTGNFTVSSGSNTACLTNQPSNGTSTSSTSSTPSTLSVSVVTVTAKPTSGSNFASGAERVFVSGFSIVGIATFGMLFM